MTNLFTHCETVVPNFFSRFKVSELLPLPEVTNTWVVFTMRPQPGRPIVGWDYVNTKISEDYQMISNCWLEASVTGILNSAPAYGEGKHAVFIGGVYRSDIKAFRADCPDLQTLHRGFYFNIGFFFNDIYIN